MKDYHINIFWSDEDAGYIADAPDLGTCSAFGETPEKALAELRHAMRAWLDACDRRSNTSPGARGSKRS